MFADSDVMFHVRAILPFCLILFSINIYQHNIFLLLNKVEVLLLRKKTFFKAWKPFRSPFPPPPLLVLALAAVYFS